MNIDISELEVITQIANEEGYKFTVEEWKSGIKEAKATLAEGENYVRETGAPIGVAEEVLGMEYLEEELLS